MNRECDHERLSRISTQWTLVLRGHAGPEEARRSALEVLMNRYHRVVYRYLAGALRDADAAEDLFQQFALRFVRGDFKRADPERGRFRDYLKAALVRLVIDYRRQGKHRADRLDTARLQAVGSPDETRDLDEEFVSRWREELLARTWDSLAEVERETGQPYHAVLRFRAEHPDANSEEMAAALTERLRPDSPLTAPGVRKILQRARERFARLLVREVSLSLESPDDDVVERELTTLGLLPYCRRAMGE